MGAMQNNAQKGKKRGKGRGSVRNGDRLKAFAKGGPAGGASWAMCHSELLQAVVHKITAKGGAVTFGLSRDLGAHSLTLMLDDSRETLWFNGDKDLDEALGEVSDLLETLV